MGLQSWTFSEKRTSRKGFGRPRAAQGIPWPSSFVFACSAFVKGYTPWRRIFIREAYLGPSEGSPSKFLLLFFCFSPSLFAAASNFGVTSREGSWAGFEAQTSSESGGGARKKTDLIKRRLIKGEIGTRSFWLLDLLHDLCFSYDTRCPAHLPWRGWEKKGLDVSYQFTKEVYSLWDFICQGTELCRRNNSLNMIFFFWYFMDLEKTKYFFCLRDFYIKSNSWNMFVRRLILISLNGGTKWIEQRLYIEF